MTQLAANQNGNTQLLTSLVVALVAVVGIVMVYSSYSGALTGASYSSTKTIALANKAGLLCGMCAKADGSHNPLPQTCYEQTASGQVYQAGENRATESCCKRACENVGWERCQNQCSIAANDVYTGRTRYSGSSPA